MAAERIHLKVDSYGASCVDEYLEYSRIVGDDDGGKLFMPEEYEAYKKKVMPARIQNRIFVAWVSPNGIECKLIGPQTSCFCTHRYIQHKTDFITLPKTRPFKIPCGVHGCRCKSYNYIPLNGSQPLRCHCKHLATEHSDVGNHKCTRDCGCCKFESSYRCACGEPAQRHKMVYETKDERISRGLPVGKDTMYKAMGGITGFSSLADGYMRLDPSGIGPPPPEVLTRPIGPGDHPFLRMCDGLEQLSVNGAGTGGEVLSGKQIMTSGRHPGEDDMAFFERRYQERRRAERTQSREKHGIHSTTAKEALKPKFEIAVKRSSSKTAVQGTSKTKNMQ